jgi:hypothetical protein
MAGLTVLVALVLVVAAVVGSAALWGRKVDVLLIGDSIMAGTGGYVEAQIEAQPGIGRVRTRVEAVPGTGLLTPRLYDWQARARELIDTYHPEVVVVLFIGNYSDTDLWVGADGKPVPNDYGPDFFREWEAQAVELTETLRRDGAQVDWVLPPPLYGDEGEHRATGMTDTYRRLQNRIPEVTLIDARPGLGGTNGEFVMRRTGVDGREAKVRADDTVHLTPAGGRLLAREIAQVVAPQLRAPRSDAA